MSGLWPHKPICELIDGLAAGVSVRSNAGATTGPAVLKTSAVHRGRFVSSEAKPILPADISRARRNVVADSLIISRMNTPALVGDVGYVAEEFPNLFLPDRLWLARAKRGSGTSVRWLTYYLASELGAKQLQGLATGTSGSMKNIPKGRILALDVPVPTPREQAAIAEALRDADGLIDCLQHLIAKKQAIKQGMMHQLLSCRTRLPGFADSWAWRPFPEVMTRINAKQFQVPAYAYRPAGRLPVVDQGQRAVVGYTDDTSVAFDPGIDGVVVFGDHTCISKFVNFKFAVGADGTQLVRALPGNVTRFMAYVLEASPVLPTGYNRHFKLLKEKVFPVPPRTEQNAIAEMLTAVDRELVALRARLTKASAIKLGLMQELLTGRTRLSIKEVSS